MEEANPFDHLEPCDDLISAAYHLNKQHLQGPPFVSPTSNLDLNDIIVYLKSIQTSEDYTSDSLHYLRKEIARLSKFAERAKFSGLTEKEYRQRAYEEKSEKVMKARQKALEKKYINTTALRQGRIDKLNELKEQGEDEEMMKSMMFLIPDGAVDTTPTSAILPEAKNNTLKQMSRSCYCCKTRFSDLHHFYDQLCPSCSEVNFSKRFQTSNLTGKIAIVTGARVKIGYQVVLKLLRAGCTVIATTRFPNSACDSYVKESDFETFKGRLHVYGLDLRDLSGLEGFVAFVKKRFGMVDVLINNACQTVRRPAVYYTSRVQQEQDLYKNGADDHHNLLEGFKIYERIRGETDAAFELKGFDDSDSNANEKQQLHISSEIEDTTDDTDTTAITLPPPPKETKSSAFEETGISHSTSLSQLALLPDDLSLNPSLLPEGLKDVNGQQLDLRTTHSWLLKIDEVSTPEIVEAMFINVVSPFVLNSKLKPLMTSGGDARPDRYIINVSAMEGKFYRYKTPNHPHTNMAKAALNMMTRTSSEDLAINCRLYMNSVDTGWVNDENPLEKASKIAVDNGFQTPIDEIDAAARILDPVFRGVNEKAKDYGKFYKDYEETEW